MRSPQLPADEELLQQVHWIRGLAWAILRDHALAQDVSQEVLLRALSGERRHGRVLRAWLAAVTRNASRSLLRERKRREARERLMARPETAPTQRDPTEALEAHRELTRAISGLPVEARQVVLLRYFEDLGFPEIGRQLGVSENAARVRLHRALGLLRALLGRDGSEWRARCLQALPAGSLVGHAVASKLTHFVIMKGIKTTALGVLALLLLLFVYSQLGPNLEPDHGLAAGTLTGQNAPSAGAEPGAAEGNTPSILREEVASDNLSYHWSLHGVAKWMGAGPAAGAQVRAVLREGYDADCPVLTETVLLCDAAGEFTWRLPPPDGAVFLSLQPENAQGYGEQRLILSGQAPPQDLWVTVKRFGLPVRGTVRNEAMEPIGGATVLGGAEPATTDEQGAFLLQGLLDLDSLSIYAHAEGYAQEQLDLAVIPEREQQANFVLTREFVVRGRVYDEHGVPVEGAKVTTFRTPNLFTLSGGDGAYALKHLSPRESKHDLYARKTGYCEAAVRIAVESRGEVEQDLILRRGTRVEGRVTGVDGEPLEGASLYIGFSPYAYNRLDAVTHQGGEFRFPNVPPGEQILVAHYPGRPQGRLVLKISEDAELLSGLQLVLEQGHFAAGKVVDEEGVAIEGAWLESQRGGAGTGQRVQSDEAGRFRLDGLAADGNSIRIFRKGYLGQEIALASVDREDFEFSMPRCGRVAGTVIDGATGLPLSAFTIRFDWSQHFLAGDRMAHSFSGAWMEDGKRFEHAEGTWSSEDELEVGTVLAIEASAPGYGRARAERVLVERNPSPDALVLRLMPAAMLRGRVFTMECAPLARAGVSVLSAEDMEDGRMPDLARLKTMFTAEDGGFLLNELTPGEAHLLVAHADWMNTVVGPITVQSGDTNPVLSIRMQSGRALRGVVREADGSAIAHAGIKAYAGTGPNLSNRLSESRADAFGRFEIPHLAPGRYQIVASLSSGTRQEAFFSIFCTLPEDRDRELVLQPTGSATIRGKLLLNGLMPELTSPLRVMLRTPGEESEDPETVTLLYRSAPVVDGNFLFEAVPPGSHYSLDVDAWSLDRKHSLTAHELVHVADGEELEVILTLEMKNL